MGVSVQELPEETLAEYWMRRLKPNERTIEKVIKISLEILFALLELHESNIK